jgi:Bifunctional DNA primase/polymerase, N-terminal
MGPSVIHFFGQHAETIVDNGYSVVAVLPGTKKPRFERWQAACFLDSDPNFVARHLAAHPEDSIALACGTKITAIDIDETDPDRALQIHLAAIAVLGDTPLVRYGEFPRRVLVYRTREPMDTARFGKFDVLGRGSKFVAYGIHPVTGKPYYWPEDNPADTDLQSLPAVDKPDIERFLERIRDASPKKPPAIAQSRRPAVKPEGLEARIVHDENHRIIDGREAYLTLLIWEEYQKGGSVDVVAHRAWRRFVADADIKRPRGSSRRDCYTIKDAIAKAKLIIRKAPVARRRKPPATHLHSFRKSGLWNEERKRQHQTEAGNRGLAPSRLTVNQAMLDKVLIDAGQCVATVSELIDVTGLSVSAVKESRRNLIAERLWVVERNVYVPSLDTDADLAVTAAANDNGQLRIAC